MESLWMLVIWLCKSLPVMGLIASAIGILALVGLLKYLDSPVSNTLAKIRSRLDLTVSNALGRFGSVGRAVILVGLVATVGPVGVPALLNFFALYWNPKQLVFHPEYGLFTLAALLLTALGYMLLPQVKRSLNSFRYNNDTYASVLESSYLCILTALLAPYIVFRLSGFVLPEIFVISLLMYPVIAFYAFSFGALVVVMVMAMIGAIWVVTASIYLVLHGLNRHPQRLVGVIGALFSATVFGISYLGVCDGPS